MMRGDDVRFAAYEGSGYAEEAYYIGVIGVEILSDAKSSATLECITEI